MGGVKVWVSEHPYLASISGLLIVVLLYVLLHRGGSSQQQQVSPNPGGLSDAAYTASLAANAQQFQTSAALQAQQGQVAAAIALGLAQAGNVDNQTQAARDVALQQTLTGGQVAEYNAAAQLQGAQAGYAAAVQQTQITTGGAIQVAGIQADVAKHNTDAQLTLGLDTNKTSLALGGLQLEGLENTNATAAQIQFNNNVTAEHIVNSQEQTKQLGVTMENQTQQLGIVTQGNVISQGIAADSLLNLTQLSDSYSLAQQKQADQTSLTVGVSQYGGNYSNNQLAALQVIQKTDAGTATSVGGNQADAAASAAKWQGISSIVKSAVSGAVGVA